MAQKNLDMDAFKQLNISYPSNVEQKLIVEKLENIFVSIDRAIEYTKQKENELISLKLSTLSYETKGPDK